jgi:multidrug efflux system membrane fusion protein
VLARIDPSLLERSLKQVEAVLAKDDAQLVKARADVARYGEIAVKGYVSKTELDSTTPTSAIAEAVVKQDKASVELARTQLVLRRDHRAVRRRGRARRSPIPGAMVAADQTDLLVINQMSSRSTSRSPFRSRAWARSRARSRSARSRSRRTCRATSARSPAA